MAIPKITPSPQAPSRNRPSSFRAEGDAFFAYIDQTFEPELNASINSINTTADVVDQNSVAALIASQQALTSESSVAAIAGAEAWISGTTYAKNTCAISQLNFQTYRRKVSGAGTTDPMNDSANWTLLIGQGAFVPVPQTSTNFDLSAGNYFKRTMSGNETWSFSNIPQDGYSWTVEVTHNGGTLTLPSSVKTPSNQVYTFTPGRTHMLMFVTSNKGTRIRLVAAPNYDN